MRPVPPRPASVDAAAPAPSGGAFKAAKVTVYIAMWYGFNIVFNILNKQTLNAFPAPWFIATFQLAASAAFMAVLWLLRLYPAPRVTWPMLRELAPVALFHTIGHVSACVSFSLMAVSFAHVVKAAEPVLSVGLSQLILGEHNPWYVWFSLFPIIAGCALSAMKEVSFAWGGFNNAMLSNFGMVMRNVYSKKSLGDSAVRRRLEDRDLGCFGCWVGGRRLAGGTGVSATAPRGGPLLTPCTRGGRTGCCSLSLPPAAGKRQGTEAGHGLPLRGAWERRWSGYLTWVHRPARHGTRAEAVPNPYLSVPSPRPSAEQDRWNQPFRPALHHLPALHHSCRRLHGRWARRNGWAVAFRLGPRAPGLGPGTGFPPMAWRGWTGGHGRLELAIPVADTRGPLWKGGGGVAAPGRQRRRSSVPAGPDGQTRPHFPAP